MFEDGFDDEAGADPPEGWLHYSSDPTPVATEDGGAVTLEVDELTSKILSVNHPPAALSGDPVVFAARSTPPICRSGPPPALQGAHVQLGGLAVQVSDVARASQRSTPDDPSAS